MKSESFSPELNFALKTAREAAGLAESVRLKQGSSSFIKHDRSPVTVADFSIQALFAARLEKEFPGDALVAEEDALDLLKTAQQPLWKQVQEWVRHFLPEADEKKILSWIEKGGAKATGRYWVLDPVDGTKGFLSGEQYAVALALIENGTVKLGVLACPNLREGHFADVGGPGTLAFAEKGKGAWQTPLSLSFSSSPGAVIPAKAGIHFPPTDLQPLKVSSCKKLSDAVLLRSCDETHMNVEKTENLLKNLNMTKPPIEMSSLAKHAMLAAGGADFFLRLLPSKNPGYREKIWDQAPGLVIIEEAGGLLTDSEGKPLDFTHGRTLAQNRGLLGANPHLHPQILSALKQII